MSLSTAQIDGLTATQVAGLATTLNDANYVEAAQAILTLGDSNSVIGARAGHVTINAGNGADLVLGGTSDAISLGNGNDTVTAATNSNVGLGVGQNQLVAGSGDNWNLADGIDDFHITAASGNNTLRHPDPFSSIC